MDFNPIAQTSFDLSLNDGISLNRASSAIKEREAAQDFEAVFIQQSLKQMRPKMEGGLFNDGQHTEVFYQFMDEALAKEIAKSPSNLGIADELMKQNFTK